MAEREHGHVGIRELRQNLSVYLERVKAGESLTVTERGSEVARLVPMPARGSSIDGLIAEGRARSATGDLVELGMPPAVEGEPLSESLRRVRDEEER